MKGLEHQTLGKYELIRQIGVGNMGTVYLARDAFALREVAIKVCSIGNTEDERAARRRRKLFLNECKAAGMLEHPNIIDTIDAGIEDGKRYIVMEYVPGAQTLDRYCPRDNLLPVEHVVSIMLRCAIALDYAHNKGVVHRDIKPKNILLTQENEVKIADFGVALIQTEDVESTQVMGALGSPRYMSPEQISGATVSNQSDIFCLGVVLYELLVGVHPFMAKTIPAVARRIAKEAHTPPQVLRPDLPIELVRVVERTLKKHPAGRYRTAMDLAGDLSLVYDEIRLTAHQLSSTGKYDAVMPLAFFDSFEESDIMEVINASLWQEFAPGDQIIIEGELGDAFYILVTGEVAVRCAGIDVDVLKPGVSFGEIGFIIKSRRTASIVARTQVSVMKVRAALIERTSLSCQLKFQKAFLKVMAERLSSVMSNVSRAVA